MMTKPNIIERFKQIVPKSLINDLFVEDQYNQFLEKTAATVMSDLIDCYKLLSSGNAEYELAQWRSSSNYVYAGSDPDYHYLNHLLIIFEMLGARGVAPFSSRELFPAQMTRSQMSWSDLPANLGYLRKASEQFGTLRFEDQVNDFLQNLTTAKHAELELLTLQTQKDMKLIEAWMSGKSLTASQEAAHVYFLLNLLSRFNGWL